MSALRAALIVSTALAFAHASCVHAEGTMVPKGPSGTVEGMTIPPHIPFSKSGYYKSHPEAFQQLLSRLPKAKSVPQPAETPAAPPPTADPPNSWQAVYRVAPSSGLSNPLLLTDGTVIVHVMCSADWYKLTPNTSGSYRLGTWSKIASMPNNYTPLYFASQILSSGKAIVNGGEYGGNAGDGCSTDRGTSGAMYDPAANSWTTVSPPSGWSNIGDAQSIIRFDGTYMLANCCTTQQAYLDPNTMTWTTTGSGKFDVNDEEGWVFLPQNRILTTDAYVFTGTCGTNSEIYNPSSGTWQTAGSTIAQLSDCSGSNKSYEVGPMVLRPDGTVVAFSGVTDGRPSTVAIFNSSGMTWSASNNIPQYNGQNLTLADAPATITPDGNIEFAASPGLFSPPTKFLKLYGNTNGLEYLPDPPNASSNTSYVYNMLTLPTGQVLLTDFSNAVYIYTPATNAQVANSVPNITSLATTLTRGKTYVIGGTNFNGVTQGNYGDDQQAATNFPIVQIQNVSTRKIFFAKTHDFPRRSITPGVVSSARFDIGTNVDPGSCTITVIANGVRSASKTVTIN